MSTVTRPESGSWLSWHNDVVNVFNDAFNLYRSQTEPFWQELQTGGKLTDDQKEQGIGYFITSEGIRLVAGRVPDVGQPALRPDLPRYTWVNEWESQDRRFRQHEGIPMNHIQDFLAISDHYALREILRPVSVSYDRVHQGDPSAMVGRNVFFRQQQEAFFISTNPARQSAHRVMVNQPFTNWLYAGSELVHRLELVVPQL